MTNEAIAALQRQATEELRAWAVGRTVWLAAMLAKAVVENGEKEVNDLYEISEDQALRHGPTAWRLSLRAKDVAFDLSFGEYWADGGWVESGLVVNGRWQFATAGDFVEGDLPAALVGNPAEVAPGGAIDSDKEGVELVRYWAEQFQNLREQAEVERIRTALLGQTVVAVEARGGSYRVRFADGATVEGLVELPA